MVARRKLFTYQVTYSIPGISSSKITQKTSGERHKSSYNIERFKGPSLLWYPPFVQWSIVSSGPDSSSSNISRTIPLSEDMNYKRAQDRLRVQNFA